MNEKQEKKRRYNQRMEYIAHFARWLDSEPPMWMFWRWRKWKRSRPAWDNSRGVIWDYDYGVWRMAVNPMSEWMPKKVMCKKMQKPC